MFSQLASKYLNLPVSSTPAERFFSVAGKDFRLEHVTMAVQDFSNS